MKHIIWADPKKEWDGFRLTRYWVDHEKVLALPLTQQRRVNGSLEKIPTTLGEIYVRFADQHVKVEDSVLHTEIKTAKEEESFEGSSFGQRLLREFLKLRNEGFDPFSAEWFFYDHDSCRDDPHESYSFFVVCKDKIVREQVSFSDYSGSGFDPFVFKADDASESSWFNDDAWREARTRFWYQKFYSESRTGQLMLLRDDEPQLYGQKNNRGPDTPTLVASTTLKLLTRTHALLWVLIILVGLILFRIWK